MQRGEWISTKGGDAFDTHRRRSGLGCSTHGPHSPSSRASTAHCYPKSSLSLSLHGGKHQTMLSPNPPRTSLRNRRIAFKRAESGSTHTPESTEESSVHTEEEDQVPAWKKRLALRQMPSSGTGEEEEAGGGEETPEPSFDSDFQSGETKPAKTWRSTQFQKGMLPVSSRQILTDPLATGFQQTTSIDVNMEDFKLTKSKGKGDFKSVEFPPMDFPQAFDDMKGPSQPSDNRKKEKHKSMMDVDEPNRTHDLIWSPSKEEKQPRRRLKNSDPSLDQFLSTRKSTSMVIRDPSSPRRSPMKGSPTKGDDKARPSRSTSRDGPGTGTRSGSRERTSLRTTSSQERPSTRSSSSQERPSTRRSTSSKERPSTRRSTSKERPSTRGSTTTERSSTRGSTSTERPSASSDSTERPSTRRSASKERPSTRSSGRERPSTRSSSRERPSTRSSSKERPSSRSSSKERPLSRSSSKERPSTRSSSKERPSTRSSSKERTLTRSSCKDKASTRSGSGGEGTSTRNGSKQRTSSRAGSNERTSSRRFGEEQQQISPRSVRTSPRSPNEGEGCLRKGRKSSHVSMSITGQSETFETMTPFPKTSTHSAPAVLTRRSSLRFPTSRYDTLPSPQSQRSSRMVVAPRVYASPNLQRMTPKARDRMAQQSVTRRSSIQGSLAAYTCDKEEPEKTTTAPRVGGKKIKYGGSNPTGNDFADTSRSFRHMAVKG